MKSAIYLWSLVLSVLLVNNAFAQQLLHLDYNCKNTTTAFAQVKVIDNRPPNSLLGYVQKGAFNRLAPISFDGSLTDSLGAFFTSRTALHKEDKMLVLILNELFMSEHTGGLSEEGTLRLSLRLYVEIGPNAYAELATIDSVYSFTGLDVTKRLLRTVSGEFCWLSGKAGSYKPNITHTYSLDQLHHLDSLEMLEVPIFTQSPVAGIYKDYEHFKNNQPDIPTAIYVDDAHPKYPKVFRVSVKKNGKQSRSSDMKCPIIYAISDGERAYRFVDGAYYEIKKSELGLYYDRLATFSNNAAMWGGLIGGISGAMIATAINNKLAHTYRFRINSRSGRSSPVAIVD